MITKEDLQQFRLELLGDIKHLLNKEAQHSNEDWMRSSQVRKLLSISAGTLQNLRITGNLNPAKIGGIYLYKRSEIMNHLSSSSRKNRQEP